MYQRFRYTHTVTVMNTKAPLPKLAEASTNDTDFTWSASAFGQVRTSVSVLLTDVVERTSLQIYMLPELHVICIRSAFDTFVFCITEVVL